MVNATEFRWRWAVLILAALILTGAAWLRGAEYDEQYTLFLTAGTSRPDWPRAVFPAGMVAAMQAGHATMGGIARDLRTTDVHPPLYFWAVSLWRAVFGPSLLATRMLSVLCGLVSLHLVGVIARRCAIHPVVAMLVTLGCYGFIYTNAIARGFAPAQMLSLCGVVLLIGRRPLLAGACLGAACCCNYLAVFVAMAVIVAAGAWAAILGAVPFVALDAWFFAAQHASRSGQFPPFALWPSLLRLAEYQTAAVFGGLPLYFDGVGRIVTGGIVGLVAIGLVLCVRRTRPLSHGPAIRMILGAAMAPPIGLLLLGVVFDNTPIELRYLSFGLPFVGLLVALSLPRRRAALPSAIITAIAARTSRILPRRTTERRGEATAHRPHVVSGSASDWINAVVTSAAACRSGAWLLSLLVTIQFAGIAGLLLSPRTMQPARATAADAARLTGDGIVVLPRGNDGVGIVGAFGIEAPPSLPILLIRPADPIADRIAAYRRVALALMAQDSESTATIAALHAALSLPNWRRVAIGSNLEVYERTGEGE